MTSFISYIPSATSFSNLEQSTNSRKKFYTLQTGKGGSNHSINLVSPSQQAVERAKEDLKRERSLPSPTPGGVQYISPKLKPRSPSKKPVKKTQSKTKKKESLNKVGKGIHKKYRKK